LGDSLGYRAKFAVVAPSKNTSVQPEDGAICPRGATNHFARISIRDTRVTDDASFMAMPGNIRSAIGDAFDVAMSMAPDAVVMGMSAETFWDGADGATDLHQRLVAQTGAPVVKVSPACDAAIKGLRCASPMLNAHESARTLNRAVAEVDAPRAALITTSHLETWDLTKDTGMAAAIKAAVPPQTVLKERKARRQAFLTRPFTIWRERMPPKRQTTIPATVTRLPSTTSRKADSWRRTCEMLPPC